MLLGSAHSSTKHDLTGPFIPMKTFTLRQLFSMVTYSHRLLSFLQMKTSVQPHVPLITECPEYRRRILIGESAEGLGMSHLCFKKDGRSIVPKYPHSFISVPRVSIVDLNLNLVAPWFNQSHNYSSTLYASSIDRLKSLVCNRNVNWSKEKK